MRHFLLGCLLALTGIPIAHAQNGKRILPPGSPPYRDLIGAGSGFLIENPEMIVGPGVSQVSVSPDGRFVLAVRYKPAVTVDALAARLEGVSDKGEPAEISLTIWDSRDDRTTVIWRNRPPASTSISLHTQNWFAGSTKAIVSVRTHSIDENGQPVDTGSFFIIDAATRTIRETIAPDAGNIYPSPSPTLPFAWLASPEGSSSGETRFLGADGTITPPIKIPGFLWFTRWSPDGTEMRGFHSVEHPDHTTTKDWYAVKPLTQAIRSIPEPPRNSKGETDYGDDDPDPSNPPFHLLAQPIAQSSTASSSVWLAANDGSEKILITGDGAPLGVTRFGALYSMAGALYVAPIREIGVASLARLRQGNIREATMERAQAICSALMMYTFTHDRLFPDASANLVKSLKLAPDTGLLKDFTYQPTVAQKSTRANDPKTSALGFVTATGGKAVLYTDGSVKWQDAGN